MELSFADRTYLVTGGGSMIAQGFATFLPGDAANWITGQIIDVRGGKGLRRGPDVSAMAVAVFGADGLRGAV